MTTQTIKVTIDEYPGEFKARIEQIPKWLQAAMVDSAEYLRREVSKASPVDVGFYKGSWEVSRGVNISSVTGSATGSFAGMKSTANQSVAEVWNDAPYAGIIELGTRPGHRAPIAPLIEWARRKAGDLHLAGAIKIGPNAFRVNKKGFLKYKGQASLDPDDEDEVERFAWAVKMAIFKRGLRPRHVMLRQIPKARLYLEKVYEHLLNVNAGKKALGGGATGGTPTGGAA